MTIEQAGVYLIGACLAGWLLVELAVMWKQRKRRNRWLSDPQRDDRCSIQTFKKIVGRG